MSADERMEILLEDLDEAEGVGEVQTNVLLLNEALEGQEPDEEFASLITSGDSLDLLTRYLQKIEDKMAELDDESGISSYSISVGGSLTGPQVTLSVTVST